MIKCHNLYLMIESFVWVNGGKFQAMSKNTIVDLYTLWFIELAPDQHTSVRISAFHVSTALLMSNDINIFLSDYCLVTTTTSKLNIR